MTRRAWILFAAVLAIGAAASGCGPSADLSKALEVTDVLTGYYDAGVKDGKNYLKPSISFRLRNTSQDKIGPVQMTVSFWMEGADGEWDSVVLQAIHAGGLEAGASTESILARGNVGYTLEGARADFFGHSQFKDITAKLFASQAGKIYALGEHKLDRVIIPHLE
jgi:hypothetical protein